MFKKTIHESVVQFHKKQILTSRLHHTVAVTPRLADKYRKLAPVREIVLDALREDAPGIREFFVAAPVDVQDFKGNHRAAESARNFAYVLTTYVPPAGGLITIAHLPEQHGIKSDTGDLAIWVHEHIQNMDFSITSLVRSCKSRIAAWEYFNRPDAAAQQPLSAGFARTLGTV